MTAPAAFTDRRRTVRFRLRIAMIVAAGLVTMLAVARARERRSAEERRLNERAQEVTETVVRSIDATVGQTEALLGSIGVLMDLNEAPARSDTVFRNLYSGTSSPFSNIFSVDTAGQLIGGARLPAGGRALASLASREYFKEALRTKRFTVGKMVRSRLLDGAPWIMPFILPVLTADGAHVTAMVGASIELDSLDAMEIARTLPIGSVISVVDTSGTVVFRSADPDRWIGQRLPLDATLRANLRGENLQILTRMSLDGVERSFGSRLTTRVPWLVYVGIPTVQTFALARSQFLIDLLFGASLGLAVLLFGYWVTNRFIAPIESLTRDAHAIAAGDVTRRSHITSLDEAGTLARAFNRMADTIVERSSALDTSREQLRQTQKLDALGSFAGGIAHDFNNYLSSIMGLTEMALVEIPADSPARDDLLGVLSSAERAADLTRQILVFSRRQVVEPQQLDVNHVIGGISRMLTRLLGERIDFESALPELARSVRADRGQLEQVVVNLAANARDAMPQGGRFHLSTQRVRVVPHDPAHAGVPPGDFVIICAADTGVGIAEAVQARMFEPFYSTKERGRGTGLGLALAYGMVQQAGGFIRVESREGHGARFFVYLPACADAPISTTLKPLSNEGLHGSERILLVEDDPAVALATSRLLTRAGYVVVTAHDAESAMDVLRGAPVPFAMILTDIVMSGRSGVDLARDIVARDPGARVLFMSGYADDEALVAHITSSRTPFLAKPFAAATLLQTVRSVLDTPPRAGDYTSSIVNNRPTSRS